MANPVVDLIGDRTGRIVPIYPQSEKVAADDVGAGRLGRERAGACSQLQGIADPVPTPCGAGSGCSTVARRSTASTCPSRSPTRNGPAAGSPSTSCCGCNWSWSCASGRWSGRPSASGTRSSGELVRAVPRAAAVPADGAQRRAIAEIEADLAAPHPMHRLLQGDVGSGKTVVAVRALLAAVQGGHQGALMAPTEVLAEQHSPACAGMLDGLRRARAATCSATGRSRVELLTNRVTGAERRRVLAGLGRRIGRHRHRHPRPDPGGRRVPQPRRRGRRRAAPLRRRAARRAAGQGRRRRCPTCW